MEELDIHQGLLVNRNPESILGEARKAAQSLQNIVSQKKKPVILNGEQYLEFEDLQTLGRFYGISSKVISTSFVEYGGVQGFEARAVAIRNEDGMEVSAAEAACLGDEPKWKTKPLFQLKSMSQTRACAKALRNVLAWVVVLAGYKPTPAEEMIGKEHDKPPIQEPQKKTNGEKTPTQKIITSITDVAVKHGERKGKNEKGEETKIPWTLFKITGDGSIFQTFDKNFGDLAVKENGSGLEFEIEFQIKEFATKDGKAQSKEIVSMTMIEPGAQG